MNTTDKIRNAILGKYPLIYLLTWEESRALQLLEAFAAKIFGNNHSMQVWSCVEGFATEGKDEKNPQEALQTILSADKKGFYILKDFSAYVKDPAVVRALRDVYYTLQGKDRYVFIVPPELVIPESLKKEILLIDVDLPDETEISKHMSKIQQNYPLVSLSAGLISQITFALKGLTLNESTHILNKIFRSKKSTASEILPEIFAEKEMIVKKSGYLEFVPPSYAIGDIGGL